MKAKPILLAVMGILALCGPAWAVDGMVSYWKLDEGSGTTVYDLFGDNHGTVYGAQWIDGQVNAALTFDGVNDYVDIPYDSSLDLNASEGISLSVWFKLNSYPAGWNQGPIFGLFDSADAGTKNYLFIDKPLYGNLITWDQAPPSYGWIKSIKPDLETWYHIVAVEDSTYKAIYLNGSLDVSDNFSESYQGNKPDTIRIGNRADSVPFYFDGSIDEVAIYDRALSVEEIEQLYDNSSAGYGYPVDTKIIATNKIERAIAKKLDTLDKVNATLEEEWSAYDVLEQLLESGDYGDLSKGDIVTAMQKIHSAIQHQQLSKKALDKSIEKLEDALAALGWQPPPPPPPMPQPVSHWTFDEGSGTTAYDSVGTNDGTVHGAIWTTGQINGALSFDGVNDYIDVGNNSSLMTTGDLTIYAWIKARKSRVCIYSHSWTGWGLGFGIGNNNYDGRLGFYTWTHRHWIEAGGSLADDTWHQVAATLEGTMVRLYTDGIEIGSDTGTPAANLNGIGLIGLYNYAWFFGGIMDDVRIYDLALSAQEIQQLYNNALAGL
ncbi:MAG: LamG-like jellyroll fold domain-containing protein [Planctomycetota bacterium]|jgi:hypothetical protein